MTKVELKQEIAKRMETTMKEAESFLETFCDIVGDTLSKEDTVNIMGFGKFSASKVAGREGRNPRNPEETITIPETYRIYFSSGQVLKDRVNASLKKEKKATVKAKKKATKK